MSLNMPEFVLETDDERDERETELMMLRGAYAHALALLRAHEWMLEGMDMRGYRQVMSEAYTLAAWGVREAA